MKNKTVITIITVVAVILIGLAIWYFAFPSPKMEVPKVTTTTMTVEQKLNIRVDSLESRMKNLEAKLKQFTTPTSQPIQVDSPLTQTIPTEVVTVQPPITKIPKYKTVLK